MLDERNQKIKPGTLTWTVPTLHEWLEVVIGESELEQFQR